MFVHILIFVVSMIVRLTLRYAMDEHIEFSFQHYPCDQADGKDGQSQWQ
ncbi:MAG: hypothetical protein RBR19_02550 [Sedimentisphaerales bacterium]|nr:hypothetical protein [Planctomycetota bacterium]MDY0354731.1 hypothetical protein [Sedimentisphaerales bacterium]NLT76216.1 hypothetical protein [Planctomycetota bacterium]